MHSVNSKNQSIFVLLSSRSMSIIRRGRKRGVTQMALKPKEHFHGSDLEKIEAVYGIKKEDIISFSANVNPLGVSFRLKETLTNHIDAITTYPDREYTSLRKCIADYVHTNYKNIVDGGQISGILRNIIRRMQLFTNRP